jgi:hypothetical protein
MKGLRIMGSSGLKIKATSLVYNVSTSGSQKDNIFLNDNFIEDFDLNKTQVSTDCEGDHLLFAISSGMDLTLDNETKETFSFMSILHENFEGLVNGTISSQVKLREISSTINKAKDYIAGFMSDEDKKDLQIGFAGILFQNGKASIINVDKSRIYLFRDKYLKMISQNLETGSDDLSNSVTISDNLEVFPGDVYVLCSESAGEAIGEEVIYEQLIEDIAIERVASNLLKRASDNTDKQKNISFVVLKVVSDETAFAADSAVVGAAVGGLGLGAAGAAFAFEGFEAEEPEENLMFFDQGASNQTPLYADDSDFAEGKGYSDLEDDLDQEMGSKNKKFVAGAAIGGVAIAGKPGKKDPLDTTSKKLLGWMIGLAIVLLALVIATIIIVFSFANSNGQNPNPSPTVSGIIVTGNPFATLTPPEVIISTGGPVTSTPVPTPAPTATLVPPTPTKTPTPTATPVPTPTLAPTPTPT